MGKRALAVDLKTEEGKQILWRLIKGADVFIEGFKPGTIQRYGFGYDAVSAEEPGILYYSISGFGQTGPLAARPAMDPVLQAFIGIVTENKGEHDNHPHRIAISLIDMFSGLLGFQAIATSLYVRREQKVKQGRFIELSLMARRRHAVGHPTDRQLSGARDGTAHQHAERGVQHRQRPDQYHHGAARRLEAVL